MTAAQPATTSASSSSNSNENSANRSNISSTVNRETLASQSAPDASATAATHSTHSTAMPSSSPPVHNGAESNESGPSQSAAAAHQSSPAVASAAQPAAVAARRNPLPSQSQPLSPPHAHPLAQLAGATTTGSDSSSPHFTTTTAAIFGNGGPSGSPAGSGRLAIDTTANARSTRTSTAATAAGPHSANKTVAIDTNDPAKTSTATTSATAIPTASIAAAIATGTAAPSSSTSSSPASASAATHAYAKKPNMHMRFHMHGSPSLQSPSMSARSPSPTSARPSIPGVSPVRLHAPIFPPVAPASSPSISNSVSTSSSSPVSQAKQPFNNIAGSFFLRKPKSVAFFVALLSPDGANAPPPIPAIDILPQNIAMSTVAPFPISDTSPRSLTAPQHDNQQQQQQKRHPHAAGNTSPLATASMTDPIQATAPKESQKRLSVASRSTPPQRKHTRPHTDELRMKLSLRQSAAAAARARLLHERRVRLSIYVEQVRMRANLHRQRNRLQSLQIQAKSEYTIAAANLKRQALLRRRQESLVAASEHAHAVMLMQKLRKFLALRRAVSENFVEVLRDVDLAASMAASRHRADGVSGSPGTLAQESLTDRRITGDIMRGFDIGNVASLRNDMDETDSEGGYLDADHHVTPLPISSPLKSTTTTTSSPSHGDRSDAGYAETGHSPIKGPKRAHSAEVETHAQRHGGLLLDGEDIVNAHPSYRREKLSTTLRKSKSMSSTLLLEADDFTYLELLTLLPPVTRFTLRELELDEILSNAQLRHDLIFDADLQFKPNVETNHEDERASKSDAYWEEVAEEVAQGHMYRVPLLLAEIRAILIELLPNGRDIKEEIESNIDVNLIAQQIDHGVMNPVILIDYIANLMKTNCAPIRDELVDKMVATCRDGDMVQTLRLCFNVVELMKLDYANHQLTRLRPYVVEHAVEFEWKWFRAQYENGSISLSKTKNWLRDAYKRFGAGVGSAEMAVTDTAKSSLTKEASASVDVRGENTPAQEPANRAADAPKPRQDFYFDALLHLILQANRYSENNVVPETLQMDTSRLVQFYNDWQDITILASLLVLFRQAAGPKCTTTHLTAAKTNLWVLLNDADTTMSHISLQVAHDAGGIRGTPFTEKERGLLNAMMEKTLAPESTLYDMIQKRVTEHLRHVTTSPASQADKTLLAKHGLTQLETEVNDLGTRVRKVGEMNRGVYGHVYMAMLEDIMGEQQAGGQTASADTSTSGAASTSDSRVNTNHVDRVMLDTEHHGSTEDDDELASPRLAAAMRAE